MVILRLRSRTVNHTVMCLGITNRVHGVSVTMVQCTVAALKTTDTAVKIQKRTPQENTQQ